MNKLRRNVNLKRLTVENMRGYCDEFCPSSCDMNCFMISCICDNLNPTQNEITYRNNHDKAYSDSIGRLFDISTE